MSHKGFCLAMLKILMKEHLGGSHIFMKSTPRSLGDRTCMVIGYNYNSQKVLRFIFTEGAISTDPGGPYLSRFPDNYSHVHIQCVFFLYAWQLFQCLQFNSQSK